MKEWYNRYWSHIRNLWRISYAIYSLGKLRQIQPKAKFFCNSSSSKNIHLIELGRGGGRSVVVGQPSDPHYAQNFHKYTQFRSLHEPAFAVLLYICIYVEKCGVEMVRQYSTYRIIHRRLNFSREPFSWIDIRDCKFSWISVFNRLASILENTQKLSSDFPTTHKLNFIGTSLATL